MPIARKRIPAIIAFCLFVAVPHSIFAAGISFHSQEQVVGVNQQFLVDALLDTQGDRINAIQGTLVFPADLFEITEIRDGGSIINLWIERPVKKSLEITFSGITPGGYAGKNGKIFSIVFQTRHIGKGVITLRDAKALRNDGEGSEASLRIFPYAINVAKNAAPLMIAPINDTEPPEAFTPLLARDPALYENKWFLVFTTEDKKSGISRYEVSETRESNAREWIAADSPYLLKDQERKSYISVKAVDKKGNERIAEIAPAQKGMYANYLLWSILISIGIMIVALARMLKRKIWKICVRRNK